MSQVVKRRSTPETKAGQYMCPECGQIFDTKKEVDSHLNMMHEPHLRSSAWKLASGLNLILRFSAYTHVILIPII